MGRKILISIVFLVFFFTGCDQDKKQTVKFYGNVDVRTVSLAFEVSGKLDTINFQEGQKVKKGELLASLDDSLYKEYIKQIDAQIRMQQAQLTKLQKGYRKEEILKAESSMKQKKVVWENMQKNYIRYKKLFNTKSITQEKLDYAKTEAKSSFALFQYAKSSYDLLKNGYEKEDIVAAQAQLDMLLSQKNQSQIHLNDTKLYSPSSGVVLTRVYEEGSIVNASQIVLDIAKNDSYWIRSYISEKYLSHIAVGMKAKIYTDAHKVYDATVGFISPIAEFTPKNVQTEDLRTDLVYRIKLNLKLYDDKIKQGMPVTIIFDNLTQL